MEGHLLVLSAEGSINNVFLLSISLTQQAFHEVSVMCSFKNTLTYAEHGLGRKSAGQFCELINQNDCRRLDADTLFM